jgi:hypothetical protein
VQGQLTELELDMLLLFYTLSDQYGNVDVVRARTFLYQHYGILIPEKPIRLKPHHLQALTDHGLLPDVNDALTRIKNLDMKPKRKRATRKKKESKGD